LAAVGVDPEEKARATLAVKSDLDAIGVQLARYQDGKFS
jgi:hypothetical protein